MEPYFSKPPDLDTALKALSAHPHTILTGGTDLKPSSGPRSEARIYLDLSGIHSLRKIGRKKQDFEIGAGVTWADLAGSGMPTAGRALLDVAGGFGGPQIRNRATICGNLCNASPASDGAVAMLALEAVVHLSSAKGTRQVAIDDFLIGPGRTAMRPDELVTAVSLPPKRAGRASRFMKTGSRQGNIIATCSAAVVLELERGALKHLRIAVGSCGPKPVRLRTLESELVGATASIDPGAIDADHFTEALNPICDHRGTDAYRAEAARILVGRCILACLSDLFAGDAR